MHRFTIAKATFAAALLTVAAFVPAAAQQSMPSTDMPTTASVDQQYLTQDAQGSVYDQSTAELGLEMASSPMVHNLAQTIVKDHDKQNMQLLNFAYSRMLSLPVVMDSDDQTKLQQLMSTPRGSAFDKAYLQESIRINSQDVTDAQQELSATKDPEVKKLVQSFLATEQKHLKLTQQTLTQLGG